jgi:hypothetical protein
VQVDGRWSRIPRGRHGRGGRSGSTGSR